MNGQKSINPKKRIRPLLGKRVCVWGGRGGVGKYGRLVRERKTTVEGGTPGPLKGEDKCEKRGGCSQLYI